MDVLQVRLVELSCKSTRNEKTPANQSLQGIARGVGSR